MLPDNIDDIFRQKLDGHATPPAPDLWARLALPTTEAEPIDTAFQEGLRGHATPPRRALWERLEEEHLRPQPRRRRVAAWWHYSAAAGLLLFVLAGGGLLWRGSYQHATGSVAQLASSKAHRKTSQQMATKTGNIDSAQSPPTIHPQDLATATTSSTGSPEKKQENFATQATASHATTSSTPIATTTRPRRAATAGRAASSHHLQRQQPDAAAGTLATTGGRHTPAGQPSTTPPVAPATGVAPATRPLAAAALAATTNPVAPAATPEIIEVDVRRGPGARATAPVVAATTEANPAPARRRGLRLGGLLRQADHLVHGEAVNLAEATGLPETVTVQAHLGGRLLSKTIQL